METILVMKYFKVLPKISVNILVILYIICFQSIVTNSGTSTLWRLNTQKTKIVEGNISKIPSSVMSFIGTQQSIFDIITSTERYGNAWIKHTHNERKSDKNDTEPSQDPSKDNHELSCGKPVNFTFYDSLVGIINRNNHPSIIEPEAMVEFIKKFKFKAGTRFDMSVIENKLRAVKKDRPKSIGTFHQLGNYWRVKGDPRRAIECFRKALAFAPHNSEILLHLAKVLFHLQYLDDAIYLTRRSLEVASPEKGAWQQYFTLGEIFKAYGHYQEAQVHFRHALDLYPGYEPALKLLKEIEEVPLSPWQGYTYFIIGSLVIVVLLFMNNLDNTSETHYAKSSRHMNKAAWSAKYRKKAMS